MIRFIIIILFILIFFIVSIILLPISWLIGVFNKKAMRNISLSIIKWVFSTIVWLAGTRLEVRGLDNVPEDQPVLYVGNHRSFFDIVISMMYVKRVTGYISKKENKKVPFLAQWMVNLNCLFLDRNDIKQGFNIILKAIDLVKEGYSICIFPEGTRNKEEGTFLPFHEGSFKIAQKSGCLIQPFVFYNSAAIFEDHFPKVKKAHVVLQYLPPIDMKAMEKEEAKHIGAYTQKLIEDAYFAIKNEVANQ